MSFDSALDLPAIRANTATAILLAGTHQYPGGQSRAISPDPGRLRGDHAAGNSHHPHVSAGAPAAPVAFDRALPHRSAFAARPAARARPAAGSPPRPTPPHFPQTHPLP